MAKLTAISRSVARMRAAGAAFERVEPGDVHEGLDAGLLRRIRRGATGGMSFVALAESISRQLASTGGRPALEGTVGRKKIPLQSGDWQSLERAVARLQRQGVRSSAGQVASVLLHQQIERLDAPAPKAGKARLTGRR